MFIGLLIGLAIWGAITMGSHKAEAMTPQRIQILSNTDPRVLASVHINGIARLIGLFAFLLGTCGTIGWIIEVVS